MKGRLSGDERAPFGRQKVRYWKSEGYKQEKKGGVFKGERDDYAALFRRNGEREKGKRADYMLREGEKCANVCTKKRLHFSLYIHSKKRNQHTFINVNPY